MSSSRRGTRTALALLLGACASPAPKAPVPPPPWMRGVWTREWIERRGVRSSRFDVHYLQTPSLYGDVRFPVDRPTLSQAHSFDDLSDADLLALAKQRGFTGLVTAAGDTITWQHEIDFQPPDGGADIGRVEARGPGRMYEHALDSSYVESWVSLASGDDAWLVVRVEGEGRLERILLVAGDHFLYVRNRPVDLPAAESLDSLIRGMRASRAQIVAYLDCEFSTGLVRAGSVPWEIRASTLPWLEGKHLAFADDIAADSGRLTVRVPATQRWQVPVNTLAPATLAALFPAR